MRKKIVAGNWKMNKDLPEGKSLTEGILENFNQKEGSHLILIPPFTHLSETKKLIGTRGLELGAQNVHHEANGAYTGEVSCSMLKSIDVEYCLVGHSERRIYQNESEDELLAKVKQLLLSNISPIFCIGESLEERESGREYEVIEEQLKVIFELSADEFSKLIIAYEPVWAIGTGKTATSDQAQDMHAFIRSKVEEKYGSSSSQSLSILYGGSCKPDNAEELFSKEDVDGGLIGGASLDASSFIAIYNLL